MAVIKSLFVTRQQVPTVTSDNNLKNNVLRFLINRKSELILQNKGVVWVSHKWLASHNANCLDKGAHWTQEAMETHFQHDCHRAGHSGSRFKMTLSMCVPMTKMRELSSTVTKARGENPSTTYSCHNGETAMWPDEECAKKCFMIRLLLQRGSSPGHRRAT